MKKFIFSIIVLSLGVGIYFLNLPPKPTCQNGVAFYDKVTKNSTQLSNAIDLIKSKKIKYSCKIIKSKYMKSQITEYIDEEKLLALSKEVFGVENSIKDNNTVNITCNLYENDKEDPRKRSESCKLLTGNLLYEFRLKDELIYKVYIDFTNPKGMDIPRRLECIKQNLFFKI